MWKCPGCGREFQRTNQGHYCGKAPADVDEYIGVQAPEARAHLLLLRSIILNSVPGVKERIAWSMPTYEREKRTASFAACKRHISLYTDAAVLEALEPQLDGFEIRKNAVYLPYNKALPEPLIADIIQRRFEA